MKKRINTDKVRDKAFKQLRREQRREKRLSQTFGDIIPMHTARMLIGANGRIEPRLYA